MDLISIFRICFYICLAFTILFFIISVVLFFLFDIKTIFNIRTGRAKQKTIKEMQAANNSTGRLRVDGKTLTSQLSKNDKKNIGKKRENIIVPPQTEPVKEQYVIRARRLMATVRKIQRFFNHRLNRQPCFHSLIFKAMILVHRQRNSFPKAI